MTLRKSHYEVLGVAQSVDGETLHKAFRHLTKALHPDTTVLPPDEAARKFRQVCEAYELLSDPIRRLSYDKSFNEVNWNETMHSHKSLVTPEKFSKQLITKEVRRTLSGGELLSLLLLVVAFLISVLLALGFAFVQGRELQVRPSWLTVSQTPHNIIFQRNSNGSVASSSNTFESTLFSCIRTLAS
ncbi:J domain-containing protein [Prochlorococcus sp. MIT 1307]|uniref:J domain-containing protein n=1 Tax=Prochlorococcus sp. MIT 1307 TaxID=3096219 RepID=UPI002A74C40C|nr:J domain-containing protein [Prochlorococcus sp. MIT 1307]